MVKGSLKYSIILPKKQRFMKDVFTILMLLMLIYGFTSPSRNGEDVSVLEEELLIGLSIGERNGNYIGISDGSDQFPFSELETGCKKDTINFPEINTTDSSPEEDDLGYYIISFPSEQGMESIGGSLGRTIVYDCIRGELSISFEYHPNPPLIPLETKEIYCPAIPTFEKIIVSDDDGYGEEEYFITTKVRDGCGVEYLKTTNYYNYVDADLTGTSSFRYKVFTVQQRIIQYDNEKPRFTHVPAELTIDCSDFHNEQLIGQATATDDCSELSITYTDSDYLDCNNNQPSTIIRTWKATDACGNMATAQTIINVLPDNNQPIDCEAVTLNEGYNNRLYIDNILAPNAIIKVFKESDYGHLQLVWSCTASCLPTESIVGLSDGDYRVDIRFFDDYWRPICQTIKRTRLGDGGNHEEEEEEEPNHGNTTTICNNIDITSTNKYITISGMGDNAADVKVFDANWNPVFTCLNGDCQNPIQIDNLSSGKYFILFKLYQRGAYNSYTLVCDELVEVEVGGNTIAPLIAAAEEKQLPQLQDFQIAPNPANDYLHLGLKKYRGEAVQIRMYNQLGNPVMERAIENVQNDLEYISLKELDNGLYFIRVEHPKYRAVTKRVVVARMY